MYATQLVRLLNKDSMMADNLRDAIALCETWYIAEPSITTFILHALFDDLAARGWDE